MALTNAERQEKHRQRIKERLASTSDANPNMIIKQLQERLDALNKANGTRCSLSEFTAHLIEQHPAIVAQMANHHSEEAFKAIVTPAPKAPAKKARMKASPGYGDFESLLSLNYLKFIAFHLSRDSMGVENVTPLSSK